MTHHEDESLLDKAKRMLGMGSDEHDHDAVDHRSDERAHGDRATSIGEEPESGHPRDDAHHPTAPGAGVSDAARARGALDANEDPAMRRDEYGETGAASGQIAMPGGEEPVVGDEDRDAMRHSRS